MNYKIFIPILAFSLLFFSCNNNKATDDKSKSSETTASTSKDVDNYSYAIGFDIGSSYLKQLADDSVNVNLDIFIQAIKEGLDYKDSTSKVMLTKSQRDSAMATLQQIMQAKQEAKQKAKTEKYEERKKTALEDGKKFLKDNKTKAGVVTEKSGMQYRIITKGNGPIPKQTDVVRFQIVGKFIDGEEFQSSRQMEQAPEVPLSQINIKGVNEALAKMPVGSKWEVVCPPELAYGDQENGVIPPHSAVVFEIELVDIVKDAPSAELPKQQPQQKNK